MLPLSSKTRPIERGASSPEKCTTVCSTPSSGRRNSSFWSPRTKRFSESVTATGICTRVVSTRRLSAASCPKAELENSTNKATRVHGMVQLRLLDEFRIAYFRHGGAPRYSSITHSTASAAVAEDRGVTVGLVSCCFNNGLAMMRPCINPWGLVVPVLVLGSQISRLRAADAPAQY